MWYCKSCKNSERFFEVVEFHRVLKPNGDVVDTLHEDLVVVECWKCHSDDVEWYDSMLEHFEDQIDNLRKRGVS